MVFEIILSILFLVFNWLDYWLTKTVIAKGGTELNPIIKFIGLLPSKIVGSILVVAAGYFSIYALIAPTLAMAGVCVWNYVQFKKSK
jgi:hypothetical protein